MTEPPENHEACPFCLGTGNFYGNDEDGDFLSCDECLGSGVYPPKWAGERRAEERES